MLISVKNTIRAGNIIVFGANREAMWELADAEQIGEDMIVNVKTRKVSKIHEKNGAYVYPMTINRKKKEVDPNAMDVGFVHENKHDAIEKEDEEVECQNCAEIRGLPL